ncbi:MAG: hypothetical protein Q9226_006132 [Calogaya cf. arnoldii]
MKPFLLAVTYGLLTAAISSAASIPNPSQLIPIATNDVPTVNLITPDGQPLHSGNPSLGTRDPRFFVLIRPGGYDLPDKSVFMAVLKTLKELSGLPFADHFHGGGNWYAPGYDGVRVTIPPHPRLQVRFAMWALADGVAHMNTNGYQSLEIHMYFNGGRGVGPVEVGIVQILRRRPETLSPSPEFPANSTTFENATIDDVGVSSSLGVPNYSLRPNFQGARLMSYGVFASIFGCINEVAATDRSQPFKARGDIMGSEEGLSLMWRPWVFEPYGPPYLYYDQMIWMFDHVAKFMIRNNRFNAGEFVLLVDDVPVGYGEFKRVRRPGIAATDE